MNELYLHLELDEKLYQTKNFWHFVCVCGDNGNVRKLEPDAHYKTAFVILFQKE